MDSDGEEKATAKEKGAAKKMGKALNFSKLTKKTLARRSRVKQKPEAKGKSHLFLFENIKEELREKNSEHNKTQNISCRCVRIPR
jgi:hypothetical protein